MKYLKKHDKHKPVSAVPLLLSCLIFQYFLFNESGWSAPFLSKTDLSISKENILYSKSYIYYRNSMFHTLSSKLICDLDREQPALGRMCLHFSFSTIGWTITTYILICGCQVTNCSFHLLWTLAAIFSHIWLRNTVHFWSWTVYNAICHYRNRQVWSPLCDMFYVNLSNFPIQNHLQVYNFITVQLFHSAQIHH